LRPVRTSVCNDRKTSTHLEICIVTGIPCDNKFLACALDGRADAIVSGDHHLLALRRFRDIPILTARQFLDHVSD
jgi:predicted nucleic acid-binding protein